MMDPVERAVESEAPARLIFSSDFISRSTIIPTSNSTMIFATAHRQDDRSAVLLPFVETRVAGVQFDEWFDAAASDSDPSIDNEPSDDDDDGINIDDYPALLSVTLPLDNALFFAWDFVRDIQVACSEASRISGGRLGLEPGRLQFALEFSERLQKQAEACSKAIASLIAGTEALDMDAEQG